MLPDVTGVLRRKLRPKKYDPVFKVYLSSADSPLYFSCGLLLLSYHDSQRPRKSLKIQKTSKNLERNYENILDLEIYWKIALNEFVEV